MVTAKVVVKEKVKMDDQEATAHLMMLVETAAATFSMLLGGKQDVTVRWLAQQLLAVIRASLEELGYDPEQVTQFKIMEN